MARLPRCSVCEKNIIFTTKCTLYYNGIPNDVLTEQKECPYYKQRKIELAGDDDLPIAKGR